MQDKIKNKEVNSYMLSQQELICLLAHEHTAHSVSYLDLLHCFQRCLEA